MPGYLERINQLKLAGQLDITPNNATNDTNHRYERNEFNELSQHPPVNEAELRLLIAELESPDYFEKWLTWAMTKFDPSENPHVGPWPL